jgi:hypothetical protein
VLPKIVGIAAPFHKMVELAANPEPVTINVNAAPPACAVDGLRLLIVEAVAGVTVKLTLLDAVPPVLTVTGKVPVAVMRLAATAAVN